MCLQEKNEVLSMSQRTRVGSMKISGDIFSIATKKKQENKLQKGFPRIGKKLASSHPGVAFAIPCHPMATGLSYKLNHPSNILLLEISLNF